MQERASKCEGRKLNTFQNHVTQQEFVVVQPNGFVAGRGFGVVMHSKHCTSNGRVENCCFADRGQIKYAIFSHLFSIYIFYSDVH